MEDIFHSQLFVVIYIYIQNLNKIKVAYVEGYCFG